MDRITHDTAGRMALYARRMTLEPTSVARTVQGRIVPILVGLAAVGMLAFSFRLDETWFARHVVQLHVWPPPSAAQVQAIRRTLAWGLRVGAIGTLLIAGAIRGGSTRAQSAAILRIAFAIICALGTGELYLRWRDRIHPRPRMTHEVFGSAHPRYGWLWTPSLSATERVAGRDIRLAFNRESVRVRFPGEELDPSAPSILFAGESVAAGQGLQYEETFASLLSESLGAQPVNLAVNGYGCDQAYLRLIDALPRFEKVLATVTTFLPVQLGRNLQDLKPRLTLNEYGTLEWIPAASGFFARLRLRRLFVNELPYSTDLQIEKTIKLTRAILRDTVNRTQARGGKALFVIPSQGPRRTLEQHPEAWLIHSVFEEEGLPYILVDLEGELILESDPHPSPQGARLIAAVLAEVLGRSSAAH